MLHDGPTIPPTHSPLPKVVERETKKLSLPDLTSTRMTLEIATRSYAYPAGRPFLRTARALVNVHRKELILRDGDEQLIFHADSTSKHPHKHGNESINMINFIDITCEDRFPEVLKFKKSNHPLSGSTTPLSDFSPSLTPFETSDYLLEEFTDELSLLDPFPPRKEDNNFDFKADLREIEFLMNQDPSTESNIETIDPILEKFTNELALAYLPPTEDDDDDLFDLNSDNDEWKKLLYGDGYKDINSEKDKNMDSKMISLVESSENASLSSSPFGNEDKVTDISQKDKNKAKRTKPSTRMERAFLLIALPTPTILHTPHTTYSGDSCGNDSHFGYDCSPQFSLNYEPEPGYIQNYNSYPHDSPSFPQQYPCCEDCGVTHEPYQCQPKNHDYYHEQNYCYDSTSIGFDQSQPHQYTVNHPIFSAHHDLLGSQKKLNITLTKVNEQMTSLTSMCELACHIVQKSLEEKQLEEEQAAKAQSWKLPVYYDDDDDEEIWGMSILTLFRQRNPVPAGFTTFSNVLFDADYDFDSGDDQSFSDEDFPKKIYSNLLFDEEIKPMKIDQHPFNAESDLIESMPNHDSSIIISSKIDSLFDEFASELTLLTSVPPGIDETDCHPEKETCFAKRLFDSHIEEIDLPFTLDDPMPPSIEDDDYDSGRDVSILEELHDNYSLSLPANESYHFDIPSPYRPPVKPLDGKTRTLSIKMMGDVSDQKVPIPNFTITCVLNQEKSPDLLSHLGFEAFQPSAECPMIINGKNIPLLDVPLFHFYPP
nr:hypothetical protein [Tanacetum cinerariifolium]